jgi:hypothetical protein
VGPTVHDVRGAPVPGVFGVAPRLVPGAVRFVVSYAHAETAATTVG